MSTTHETEKVYRIGGYVKRAKLNLRNEGDIRAFHRGIFERRFGGFEDGDLVDVYIDITGYKETCKRPEMLRLMRDCAEGKVNLIFAETKGYLAANTREFCQMKSSLPYKLSTQSISWNGLIKLKKNVQILEKTGICTFVVSTGLLYNCVVLKGRNRFHLTRPEI